MDRINGYFRKEDVERALVGHELRPGRLPGSPAGVIHLEEIPHTAIIRHSITPMRDRLGHGVIVGLPLSLAGVPGRLIFIPEESV